MDNCRSDRPVRGAVLDDDGAAEADERTTGATTVRCANLGGRLVHVIVRRYILQTSAIRLTVDNRKRADIR
jgi:hypothetical protein